MKETGPRILEAATRIFARDGISGATTREIARAARVNEVTLFRHFRNKNELLRQVVLQKCHRYEHVFAEAAFATPDDLRRTVQAFVDVHAKSMGDHEDFVRTFIGELNRHLKLCRRLFVESSQSVRHRMTTYLASAQKRGLVRKDVDVVTATDALTGMLMAGMLRRPLTGTQYSSARYAKTCLELFLRGIEP